MPLNLPDPQLPGNPQDALQSIQRNFEALAQTFAPPVPTGTVLPYAAATAPEGYLICDGGEVPVATYPRLDALLGTTYGARTDGSGGAGTSHFRLPDLRGRVAVGKGTNGDVNALNDNDGQAEADRTPKHHHLVPTPTGGADGTGAFSFTYAGRDSNPNTIPTTPYNATSGAGLGSQDTPSYITLNYIIKA